MTQTACALLLGGSGACESSHPDTNDAGGIGPETFKLCDGSDDIRLGYQSGGGFVDDGYGFEQPYGFQFLFVDGHCDFILAQHDEDTPGRFVHGHLSEDAAAELTQRLSLESLPIGLYFDKETCPDAGAVSLATPDFYGDCTCGCDDAAPASLERALSAVDDMRSDFWFSSVRIRVNKLLKGSASRWTTRCGTRICVF